MMDYLDRSMAAISGRERLPCRVMYGERLPPSGDSTCFSSLWSFRGGLKLSNVEAIPVNDMRRLFASVIDQKEITPLAVVSVSEEAAFQVSSK